MVSQCVHCRINTAGQHESHYPITVGKAAFYPYQPDDDGGGSLPDIMPGPKRKVGIDIGAELKAARDEITTLRARLQAVEGELDVLLRAAPIYEVAEDGKVALVKCRGCEQAEQRVAGLEAALRHVAEAHFGDDLMWEASEETLRRHLSRDQVTLILTIRAALASATPEGPRRRE